MDSVLNHKLYSFCFKGCCSSRLRSSTSHLDCSGNLVIEVLWVYQHEKMHCMIISTLLGVALVTRKQPTNPVCTVLTSFLSPAPLQHCSRVHSQEKVANSLASGLISCNKPKFQEFENNRSYPGPWEASLCPRGDGWAVLRVVSMYIDLQGAIKILTGSYTNLLP